MPRSRPNEPLTREKLSPVLAMLKADSTEQGLQFAEQMVAFDGLGHSAAIHTANHELAKTFGTRVKALRVIWNSPPPSAASATFTTPSCRP